MTVPLPALRVVIRDPQPDQEFPVGAEVLVEGLAAGTGGAEPHPIDQVTVRLDAGPEVQATLTRPPAPSLAVTWTAAVRLADPGAHQISATATNDVGRTATARVAVATIGTTHCQSGVLWENYPRTLSLTPALTCVPVSLAGLVDAVRDAEAAGRRAHASGSRWSFSDCAITRDVSIDTRRLNRHLQTVQQALRPGVSTTVFHVEAGMTIQELYHRLDSSGLALETMGGAAGQTLAGALQTSAHGGDKALAPLADSVLALHLVGSGGTERWIEPSNGITDAALLRERVAPGVDPANIVYDDDVFNACLVALGCMGAVYAVVLRVREQYDLIETTVPTTWRAFQEGITGLLDDPTNRFLQGFLGPYPDAAGEHLCLVTTRSEAPATVPLTRSRDGAKHAVVVMIAEMTTTRPDTPVILLNSGALDLSLPGDVVLGRIAETVLAELPELRPVLVRYYDSIIRGVWPEGALRGLSYSLMDQGYGQPDRPAQPGHSVELFFPAVGPDARPGCAQFVDAAMATIARAQDTFFVGYVSIRFMAQTRAHLGMQQWPGTCSVEISVVQGVRELPALIEEIYREGIAAGGLPHWGQQVDIGGQQGYAGVYRDYPRWRQVYGRLSAGFGIRTFATDLSDRWNLTRAADAGFVSQDAPDEVARGRHTHLTVIMRNTGVFTWTAAGGFVLAPRGTPDAAAWGLEPVAVARDVSPGEEAAFGFDVAAPEAPGIYRLSWRMRDEGAGAFGAATPGLAVRVVAPGPVTVPDVVDLRGGAAARIIHDAGLVPRPTGATMPPNHVISQAPAAGIVVDPGSDVTLRLGKGDPP
jgi:FAD binding domain/PASTA domain